MSGSIPTIIVALFILLLTGCAVKTDKALSPAPSKKAFEEEDIYILTALEYETHNDLNKSILFYQRLYDETSKPEYLEKLLMLNIRTKNFKGAKKLSQAYLEEQDQPDPKVYRYLIASLINLKEHEEALNTAFKLLEIEKDSHNYQIVGNIYYNIKDYKNAIKYYESAYAKDLSAVSLSQLVNILYNYTDEKDKAVSYLETHSRIYGCDYQICSKLLLIYQENKDIEGMISTLKRTYKHFEKKNDTEGMKQVTKMLLHQYFQKNDLESAIKLLENNKFDDLKLISLYKQSENLKKAIPVLERVYKNTGNIDYLAQIAIMEYESAKDRKKVLPGVVRKFESVLSVMDNDTYQNFLGYLLIDHDVDVKKGLLLVKKALEKDPDNMAYIDSLAWGQYKLGKCKKAYKNMKKVVDNVGLNDDEIILHWKKIKECYAEHTGRDKSKNP